MDQSPIIPLPQKNPDGSYSLDDVYIFIDRMRHNKKTDTEIAFLLGVETHRIIYFDQKRKRNQ